MPPTNGFSARNERQHSFLVLLHHPSVLRELDLGGGSRVGGMHDDDVEAGALKRGVNQYVVHVGMILLSSKKKKKNTERTTVTTGMKKARR